jgi:ankyrin repeat protein
MLRDLCHAAAQAYDSRHERLQEIQRWLERNREDRERLVEAATYRDDENMTALHHLLNAPPDPNHYYYDHVVDNNPSMTLIFFCQELLGSDADAKDMLWSAYQNCDCYVVLILLLLALAPAALQVRDSHGRLPLHWAIEYECPILDKIIDLYPQAVKVQDFHGWLPLHLACCCNDFITLQNLLRLYREGAGVKDNDGNLPIHLACHNQLHYPSHLKRLIDEYPKGLRTPDLDGNLPIHIACKRTDNVFALDILLKSFPSSIAVKNRDGLLPSALLSRSGKKTFFLHEATCEGLSKHLIKLLLKAFPESCKERDQYGMLPLHYACEKVAAYSEEGRFVKRILEEYYLDDNANCAKKHNQSTLHSADSIDIILLLLKANPASATIYDYNGRRPTPPAHFSNFASEKDSKGMMLLHREVASTDGSDPNILGFLVKANPSSVTAPDNCGMLPFHHACLNEASSIETLMFLLQQYPECLTKLYSIVPK